MHCNTKSFHITIAGVTFRVTITGARSRSLHSKLRKALSDFVCSSKRPSQNIKISVFQRRNGMSSKLRGMKDERRRTKSSVVHRPSSIGILPVPERKFEFNPREKTLEVLASKKILKNSKLWRAFLDILIKYLREAILSYPNIILLHSAACAKNNKGYLFLGPAQSGKSTVAKFSRRYTVLSDDKTLVKRIGAKYYIHQIPPLSYEFTNIPSKSLLPSGERPKEVLSILEGRVRVRGNANILIDKIFLLRKGKTVRFKKISKAHAMAILLERVKDLNRIFKPDIKKVFAISYGMASSIPAFQMHFKKDPSFWQGIGRL